MDLAGNAAGSAVIFVDNRNLPVPDLHVTVVGSSSIPASGWYVAGEKIELSVSFGLAVTVEGRPEVAMRFSDSVSLRARYVSGSGTRDLEFQYTVQPGDAAPAPGVSVPRGTIHLAGGSITADIDRVETDADLTHRAVVLSDNTIRVDASPPAVRPPSGLENQPANGNRIRLVLSERVSAGQEVTVTYTDPDDNDPSGVLQDVADNDAAGFGPRGTINKTPPNPGRR